MAYLMVDSLTARYSEYPKISEISFLVAKIVHCYFFSMMDWDDISPTWIVSVGIWTVIRILFECS